MFADIIELRDFYQSPLGLMARRVLRAHIGEMWPNMRGERVLVLGYGVPLLRPLSQQVAALYAFMPAAQGVSYWPRDGANVSSLVEIDNLPLPDGSIDRVILLHALEGVSEPELLLREIWRVMKGSGRILTIVPNRRGLWAHSDLTPFGTGQPYSPSQIKRALHNQGFLVERSRYALYALPTASRLALSLADKIEKYGALLFPGFGGVLLLEASKQLYVPLVTKAQLQRRLVLPLSMPVPLPS
ncbi:MAG: methyltransferase domain-containing protein [Alphaproteobacteria bacterium]